MAVGAELGRAAVGVHGFHGALGGCHGLVRLVKQPVFSQLHIHHVTLFQVDDLVGHTGQCHSVAGQKVLLPVFAHAQNQRRASARANQALRLIFAKHRNGIGAMQLVHRRLHRLKQVAVVQAVDQVGDDLGVGLAVKHIAFGFEDGTQLVVVFNDAVVYQGNTARLDWGDFAIAARLTHRANARAVAEMRVGIVHSGRAVGGPTGMGNAQTTLHAARRHLGYQLCHACGAAGAAQAARVGGTGRCGILRVHGHAARVITPVLQPL